MLSLEAERGNMAKGDWKKALEKVPQEKRAGLETALASVDEFLTELDAGYMRQDDYSRNMDAAKKEREEWEAEKALMEENYAKAKKNYDEMYSDWTKTAEEKKVATEALKKAEEALAAKNAEQKIDPEKFMSVDRYKDEMNKFASGQSIYFSETLDAAYQIEQVTGTRVNPAKIYEEAIKAKKSPLIYAEETYKLADKRKEKEEAQKKKDTEEAEKRGYEKRVSEEANPNTRQHVASDHPFYQPAQTGDNKPKQPWEMTDTPADEQKFLQELTRARG